MRTTLTWQEIARFWSKVNVAEFKFGRSLQCWEWKGSRTVDGYGVFYLDREDSHVPATHVALLLAGRDVPAKGQQPDHLCRNPPCVNPDHLEVVSKTVNVLRGIGPTATNKRKNRCPRGHKYDKRNKRGSRECSTCNREIHQRNYIKRLGERNGDNRQIRD